MNNPYPKFPQANSYSSQPIYQNQYPMQTQYQPQTNLPNYNYVPNSSIPTPSPPTIPPQYQNGILPPSSSVLVNPGPVIPVPVVPIATVPVYTRPYCPHCNGSGFRYNGRRCVCNGGTLAPTTGEMIGLGIGTGLHILSHVLDPHPHGHHHHH